MNELMTEHGAEDHHHSTPNEIGIHTGKKNDDHAYNEHSGHSIEEFKKRFWISCLLTIPILVFSHTVQEFVRISIGFPGVQILVAILSTGLFFYGGYPFLVGTFREIAARRPGMMTLIGVAISSAYLYGIAITAGLQGMDFSWELATLIDIMLLGHWIEMKSVLGASNALETLVKLMPSVAHRQISQGQFEDIAISSLAIDNIILVKPGEKFPADGIVIDGSGAVNEALVTGESKPVIKQQNDTVIGGSINGEGSLTFKVSKAGKDSFLSQVIGLVREAQESRSRTQDLANRAALWLTIVALTGGIVTFLIWYLAMDFSLSFSLERAVTVMVISCPHALGLAMPLVVSVSTMIAAKKGLLIRDRSAFESARLIKTIVFDKTGTITEGTFGVTEIILLSDSIPKETALSYAASIESYSEHPIAKAIRSSSRQLIEVTNSKAIAGKGVEGIVNGKHIQVVSPGYLKELQLSIPEEQVASLYERQDTVVFLVIENVVIAAITLADRVRPQSKEAITALKAMGIKTIMLTGDNQVVAKRVADEVGIDDYKAEVLPASKSEAIRAIQTHGGIVAMVGDGINDAPALAQADIGMAIGTGTDVAAETADIILIKNDLRDVVTFIQLASSTYKKMVQNLFWATGYNVITIPLAAGVLYGAGIILSPAVGAILMSLSTIMVAINAKLLTIK
ncbi:MAG TPA: copper-translocating P-type ATPase [Candidatus Kapabacteria bacterium]|nr:copper-translocating P-type ATPase [Candidatus Kapabacteria bacterium]